MDQLISQFLSVLPTEVYRKILLKLDSHTLCTSFPLVCRETYRMYLDYHIIVSSKNVGGKTSSSRFYPSSDVTKFLEEISQLVELSIRLISLRPEGEFGLENIYSLDIVGLAQDKEFNYIRQFERSRNVKSFLQAIQGRELKALEIIKWNDITIESDFLTLLTKLGVSVLRVKNCSFSRTELLDLTTIRELHITMEGGINFCLDSVPTNLEKLVFYRYRLQNREGNTNIDTRKCTSLRHM